MLAGYVKQKKKDEKNKMKTQMSLHCCISFLSFRILSWRINMARIQARLIRPIYIREL